MRPLSRTAWHGGLSGMLLVDAVFQSLGRYCAACERRLTAGALLWHAPTGRLIGGRAGAAVWDGTLPLCAECAAATEGRPGTDAILLPDRDLTFRVGAESPLRYERREAVPAAAGRRAVEAVVVVGDDERARATIAHFDLNTPYYDDDTGRFTLPAGRLLGAPDPRLELRTRTWDLAAGYLTLLRDPDPAVRTAGEAQVRGALYHAGFWSVWATVAWQVLGTLDAVVHLLAPPEAPRPLAARLGGPTATGVTTDFPGTRADWLPPTTTDDEGSS